MSDDLAFDEMALDEMAVRANGVPPAQLIHTSVSVADGIYEAEVSARA